MINERFFTSDGMKDLASEATLDDLGLAWEAVGMYGKERIILNAALAGIYTAREKGSPSGL